MAHFSILGHQMKIMHRFLLLPLMAFFAIAAAFRPITGLEDVINALKNGDAQELSKYVDDNIEISLPGKSDSYSRSQALVILQAFFTNNGVKTFEVKFKGDNGGSQYCVGTLQTRSGNFRTTFLLTNRNGKQFVKEIRFQSQ